MRLFQFMIAFMMSLVVSASAFALEAPLPMEDAFQMHVSRNGQGQLTLTWEMKEGYYLYREYLTAKSSTGEALTLETPAGKMKDDPGFGETEIYYKTVSATVDPAPAVFTVTYQGCQEDGLCYPPTERVVDSIALTTTDKSPRTGLSSSGQSNWSEAEAAIGTDEKLNFTLDASGATGMVGDLLARGGVPLLMTAFFGLGILLAFTPCVFPMYPILAATLAQQREKLSAKRGLALSLAYVVALAFAFGLLGVAAAWSGQNLQLALQSPIAVIVVALLFVALGLSSFGLFELQLPTSLTKRMARHTSSNRGSIGSAAVLGFTSALIVGPCVTAPLAGALLYIAQTGNVLVAASSLFMLGLGKGVPLILMGTFGAGVLPRAGGWMSRIRPLFGFLFFASAVWLVEPLLPTSAGLALWSVLILTFGVFMGAFDSLTSDSGPLPRASKSLGLLAALAAIVLAIGAAGGSADPFRPLAVYVRSDTGAASATIEKKDFARATTVAEMGRLLDEGAEASDPTLVYFTADWCVTCRTVERRVLPEPTVQAALKGIRLVEVDLTSIDAEKQELMRQMRVVGPPTMIFFDASKTEVQSTRLVGEVRATALATSATSSRGATR